MAGDSLGDPLSRQSITSVQSRTVARAPSPAVTYTARLELLEYYLVHHDDSCAARIELD